MPPEVAKYLYDAEQAAARLVEFTRGKTFVEYQADALLRAAVERQFITIGEAMMRAEKIDASAIAAITGLRQIVGFRNVLVHGYSSVLDATVWGVVENDLARFVIEIRALLASATPPYPA